MNLNYSHVNKFTKLSSFSTVNIQHLNLSIIFHWNQYCYYSKYHAWMYSSPFYGWLWTYLCISSGFLTHWKPGYLLWEGLLLSALWEPELELSFKMLCLVSSLEVITKTSRVISRHWCVLECSVNSVDVDESNGWKIVTYTLPGVTFLKIQYLD